MANPLTFAPRRVRRTAPETKAEAVISAAGGGHGTAAPVKAQAASAAGTAEAGIAKAALRVPGIFCEGRA